MVKNMGFLWYFSLVCVFQTQIINQLAKTVIISCCPVYERVSSMECPDFCTHLPQCHQ